MAEAELWPVPRDQEDQLAVAVRRHQPPPVAALKERASAGWAEDIEILAVIEDAVVKELSAGVVQLAGILPADPQSPAVL